jgi:hypothetical protein
MNDRLLDLRSGAAAPQSVALEVKSVTNPLAAGGE